MDKGKRFHSAKKKGKGVKTKPAASAAAAAQSAPVVRVEFNQELVGRCLWYLKRGEYVPDHLRSRLRGPERGELQKHLDKHAIRLPTVNGRGTLTLGC